MDPCKCCKLPWVGSCCPAPCCGLGCPNSPCIPSVPGYCGPAKVNPISYTMCPPKSQCCFARTYCGIPVLTNLSEGPCCQSCCCPTGKAQNNCRDCIKIQRCKKETSCCSDPGAPIPPRCGY